MAEAATRPDDWAIDQARAEYEAYCAGERLSISVDPHGGTDHPAEKVQCFRVPMHGGELQFCGAPADKAHWHAVFVGGGAVTPLVVGPLTSVGATKKRVDQGDLDLRRCPPPVASFGQGVRRHFTPAQGRHVIGVAQEGPLAVLLVALGGEVAVTLVEGSRWSVLDIKAPTDLREVHVERMRNLLRVAPPVRVGSQAVKDAVPPATRAHHLRIVHGPPEVADAPSVSKVLARCFVDLERRARALRAEPKLPGAPARRPKGKKYLRRVLRGLLHCCAKNSGDLVGLVSRIYRLIRRYDPSLVITLEALTDVLNLLRKASGCLVTRGDDERLWHIHLAGLNDPRSGIHRALLEETQTAGGFAEELEDDLQEDRAPVPPVPAPPPKGPVRREPEPTPMDDSREVEALQAASAPIVSLALKLATWEASAARDPAEIEKMRARVGAVIRELVAQRGDTGPSGGEGVVEVPEVEEEPPPQPPVELHVEPHLPDLADKLQAPEHGPRDDGPSAPPPTGQRAASAAEDPGETATTAEPMLESSELPHTLGARGPPSPT